MSIWAIVPVKPLRRGKSRLAGTLSEDERTRLNRHLLELTLQALSEVPEIEHTLVVSRDTATLALARDQGARTLLEDGAPHLNTALRRATAVAQAHGARGVLILPADLPLIDPKDVQSFLRRGRTPPVVVIAPDRHQEGTNGLLIQPPDLIEYSFGPGSFQRHCERARQAGVKLEIVNLPSLALDLDLPEDLALLDGLEGMKVR